MPPLCLAGRLTAHNDAVLQLDRSILASAPGGGAESDLSAWPEFHNGVAAGEHRLEENARSAYEHESCVSTIVSPAGSQLHVLGCSTLL